MTNERKFNETFFGEFYFTDYAPQRLRNLQKIKNDPFVSEFIISDQLDDIAEAGKMAAVMAVMEDDYENDDSPFVYGKLNGLGYIVALNHLIKKGI